MQHSNPDNLLSPLLPDSGQTLSWARPHGAAFGLALVEAARQHAGPVVVVIEDQRQLQILESEIRFFLGPDPQIEVAEFPAWECLPYDNFSPHPAIV